MLFVALRAVAFLFFLSLAGPALASPVQIVEPATAGANDDAKVCAVLARAAEKALGIPEHLLRAVGVVESGRYDRGLGRAEPWPWTINAEGAGAMFRSKTEAIAKVEALRAAGTKSIDIGCMQVNLAYHGDAFESLDEAFDPVMNVAYAAHFLTSLKEERGSWNAAVAAYHSSTPKFGIPYRQKVAKTWHGLRGAVAQDNVAERRAAIAAAYQKRKEAFAAHQAKVLETQKAKREARRQAKAKAQRERAVEAVRGDTTPDGGEAPTAADAPGERARAVEDEAGPLAVASRCEETVLAAPTSGKRQFDPSLARRIMAISASDAMDDGFSQEMAALDMPAPPRAPGAIVASPGDDAGNPAAWPVLPPANAIEIDERAGAAAIAAAPAPGCPRLIERPAGTRDAGTKPVVIRG